MYVLLKEPTPWCVEEAIECARLNSSLPAVHNDWALFSRNWGPGLNYVQM